MQTGWPSWVGYLILCALIFVSSCEAWRADPPIVPVNDDQVKTTK